MILRQMKLELRTTKFERLLTYTRSLCLQNHKQVTTSAAVTTYQCFFSRKRFDISVLVRERERVYWHKH